MNRGLQYLFHLQTKLKLLKLEEKKTRSYKVVKSRTKNELISSVFMTHIHVNKYL